MLACVELMPYSSGLNRNIVQCLQDFNIPLYLSHTVVDIQGKERLESVTVAKVDENRRPIPGSEFVLKCDTLLLSVGLIPENELSIGAGVQLSPATSGAVVDNALQTNIDGIFACGNVLHVHDLVDFVSDESFLAGRSAAEYVHGAMHKGVQINIQDGRGVRGCVPQKILLPNDIKDDFCVSVMFRTDRVYRQRYITAFADDEPIFSQKKMILTPGEMVVIKLDATMLKKCQGKRTLRFEVTDEKC